MLKEFIEHIQSTTKPQIFEKDGATFVVYAEEAPHQLRPDIDHPDILPLHSLDALVNLVRTEASKAETPLYITIPDHLTVRCFGQPQPDARFFRQMYYEAKATDVPGWGEMVQLGFYALKLLSDICCGAKVVYNDNGIATTVTTQKGVALQSNEQIRPIITLKPYRTFQEVEQPESIFLIRVNERGITFTEADGGMWKLKARQTVKAFLEEQLAEEVAGNGVYIAL